MIRNAVGAMVIQGAEMLLVYKVKRSLIQDEEPGMIGEWDFPKGGVEESDPDLKSSILRELHEETGSKHFRVMEQLKQKICFSFDEEFSRNTGFTKQETTMFIVEYLGDRSDLLPKDNEIQDIKFVRIDEVQSILTHKDTREFFAANQTNCVSTNNNNTNL